MRIVSCQCSGSAFLEVDDEARQLLARVQTHGSLTTASIDVRVHGVRVFGLLPGVAADSIVYATVSKMKPKYRLRAFVLHVFAALQRHATNTPLPSRTVVEAKVMEARETAILAALGFADPYEEA